MPLKMEDKSYRWEDVKVVFGGREIEIHSLEYDETLKNSGQISKEDLPTYPSGWPSGIPSYLNFSEKDILTLQAFFTFEKTMIELIISCLLQREMEEKDYAEMKLERFSHGELSYRNALSFKSLLLGYLRYDFKDGKIEFQPVPLSDGSISLLRGKFTF